MHLAGCQGRVGVLTMTEKGFDHACGHAQGCGHDHGRSDGQTNGQGHACNHAHAGRTMGFAIVTCSDTRSRKTDTAGAALERLVADRGWDCVVREMVPDDRVLIGQAIARCGDLQQVDVVLTCGGTGLSPRDVTPDATRDVCDREVPGIAEGMRAYSMQITDRAMLSRAICAQRGSTLVVNLPGSEKAARENWRAIVDVLEHAVEMMAGGGH